MIQTIQKGDLVAYSEYLGMLKVGVYAGKSHTALHFWPLHQSSIDRINEGKKPYVRYIAGEYQDRRVVKVTPDVLEPEELKIYKILKGEK
jgi:hypothetical protein